MCRGAFSSPGPLVSFPLREFLETSTLMVPLSSYLIQGYALRVFHAIQHFFFSLPTTD